MNEELIKKAFCDYMTAEMNLLDNTMMEKEHPDYSKKFNRRFRSMVRSQKYFHGSVRMYKITKKVAVFAIIILSLLGINEISASVWGFSLWNLCAYYDQTNDMNVRIYDDKKGNSSEEAEARQFAVRDEPICTLTGMKETFRKNTSHMIALTWSNGSTTNKWEILYSRIQIEKGEVISKDATHTKKEQVNVGGWPATIYYRENDDRPSIRIDWEDDKYTYTIDSDLKHDVKNVIIEMAESLYTP